MDAVPALPSLPPEILLIIAFASLGTYNVLLRTCRDLHNVLGGRSVRKEAIRRFIRPRVERLRKYCVLPNGSLHGIEVVHSTCSYGYRFICCITRWSRGVKHGIELNFGVSEAIDSVSIWNRGKLHGTQVHYRSGFGDVLRTIDWADGVKHGVESAYSIYGMLRHTTSWVNGKKHGPKICYDNGIIKLICEWVDGVKHGQWIKYGSNGLPCVTQEWANDEAHGQCIIYDKYGSICRITDYVHGIAQCDHMDYYDEDVMPKPFCKRVSEDVLPGAKRRG